LLHEFEAQVFPKTAGKSIRFVSDLVARAGRPCAHFRGHARKLSDMANHAGTKEAARNERERDFFCVVRDAFRCFAQRSSILLGSAWAFCGAVLVIVVWLITGPTFHFSDTWQLIINTATTVVTFLMVFLIQNTQNRDAKAMHLKMDELIRAMKGARNQLVDLEELSDDDLKKLEEQFRQLRKQTENSRTRSENGQPAKSR
jgi:low affinity Fe/Cu permease